MARYTIQAPDGRKITIDAADEATAINGAKEWTQANPISPGEVANPSQAFTDAMAGQSARGLNGTVNDVRAAEKAKADAILAARPLMDKIVDATGATVNGLVNGTLVIGPAVQNLSDAIGGTISQVSTGDFGPILTPDKHANSTAYSDYVKGQRDIRAGYADRAPLASISGNVVGALATYGGLAKIPGMATTLGVEAVPTVVAANGQKTVGLMDIVRQATNAAGSNQIIGTADSMARGDTPLDAFTNNLTGSGIAAALPVLSAGTRAAGRFANEKIIRPIAALANRENEATTRLAGAMGQDLASGARMTAADEAMAAKAGADVVNADRFGSAIRTLARTASNVSPEADNAFKNLTEQRFLTQGNRAVNFVKTLMGGATDDLALQDRLRTAARATNKEAYDAAYAAPKAKAIWSTQIRQLATATPFKQALKEADEVAANEAAITGQKAIRNPFTFDADGNVTGLRPLSGGGYAYPNLEYWDIVQRTLRTKADEAAAAGKRLLSSQIKDMRTALLNELDGAVPQFKKARQGAAGFFGAEDSIDAGKKAWASTKSTPEIERAVAGMSKAEKEAFSVGFSSEMIDAINASKDRVNVINSIFGSQSARDRIRIVLGPQKARELEAYVKVEQTLHLLKDAVSGNSTTAKQLIAAGVLGGGGGFLMSGGDPTQALGWAGIAAAGRRGLQMLGKRVDDQVMKVVAEALASSDPAKMQRAIQNASISQAHLDAITAVMTGLQTATRGVMSGSTAATSGPVDLGVIAGGNPALAGTGY